MRHSGVVRATHWIITLAFLALLVTGVEIVISHPRFYWGETGNSGTPTLFRIPIPSSRATVPTGYGYVLPDQNGWSRYLHFEAAWAAVLTGALYWIWGVARGHFRFGAYNPTQKAAYLGVIFVLAPVMVWTGLAMSPGFTAAAPWAVTFWGGQQSARTIHFFATVLLVLFLGAHLIMVWRTGWRRLVGAMITGRMEETHE